MKDTALLVVSFGTSYKETREKTIEVIEREMAEAFKEADVKRAFTSGMIIKRMKQRDGILVNNVDEALKEICDEGYKNVLIQPTHIINGDEFEKMLGMIMPYVGNFEHIKIGRPMLTTSNDYERVVNIIMEEMSDLSKDEALVLMGHGTGHYTDAAYAALDYRFKAMGYKNVFVGTVEGYPELDDIIPMIKEYNPSKIRLLPFMIVAGDHATNDMAGDDEDSWKNVLLNEGFEVECIIKGLGEMEGIRQIYIDHLKEEI